MLLRGIPEDTPLSALAAGFTSHQVSVGYGSDPNDLSRYLVVLDLNAREGLLK